MQKIFKHVPNLLKSGVKITYIRKDGNFTSYSDKGITVGYIAPVHMPIGVVGFIDDAQSARAKIDLKSMLKALEQKGYPPDILKQIVAKNDTKTFNDWLKNFPVFYDPGILFMMYLLEQRGKGRISASALSTGLSNGSEHPLAYRGFFVNGQHSASLIQQNGGNAESVEDAGTLSMLSRNLKAKFGEALDKTKVEIPLPNYSGGKPVIDSIVIIRPREGIEALLA